MGGASGGTDLLRASHPGPTVAVTLLTALLAVAAGTGWERGVLVTTAVLAGQPTIGWSNDLVDADRDRSAGRTDKPVAMGSVSRASVNVALLLSVVAAVALSAMTGWPSASVHLVLVVGSGWAYNLGLKSTVWSWVPYAMAFGSLPAVVWLAADPASLSLPPAWMMLVGAVLGVGAHLLNVLPDLADDELTGVRGLPHRLGERRVRLLAPLLLLAGAVVVVLAPRDDIPVWAWAALAVSAVLAALAWATRGSTPFIAAMLLALVNVAGLVLR
ncbi:UbiA family prenyltransferase [Ornithinimicrobium cerasi]|uniref:UbiA family prenyltransferase n=1 Tax=Ornithinimicrobium cerasi TaxID=2248773 RepID=UPI000EFEDE52|nr:UbiA family prenyltransferase [Ornithinimicrobium cerasi]